VIILSRLKLLMSLML